ncbi:MAG: acyl-CoA dehydrogenase family protein, partial [Pseudomonadota bacterium]
LEGCGRFALPVPVLAAFGVGPLLVAALGGERKSELFKQIATAATLVCPLLDPLDSSKVPGRSNANLSVRVDGDRLLLDGEARGVETVPGATHYLIACSLEQAGTCAPALCLVPAAGIDVRDRIRMDARASADIRFGGVAASARDVLATGEAVRTIVEQVRDKAALLAGVETVAAMGALLEQTIAYLTDRKQFGATLSSFQVLRHYVADMYVAYENLRALLNRTLQRAAAEPVLPWEEVALVKLRLSDAARLIAHTAIQLHGGMGVTEELQATRLAKRILMSDFEYGDGAFHAERLLAARAA